MIENNSPNTSSAFEMLKEVEAESCRSLALPCGLPDEELDFIINYDIKYRMGGSDDEGEQ